MIRPAPTLGACRSARAWHPLRALALALGAAVAGLLPAQPPGRLPVPVLPDAVDAEHCLTLEQALEIGLRQNPQMLAASAAVQSARANYNSQRAPLNPTVGYSALNNTVAPADYGSGFGVGSNYSAYVTLETNGAIRYRTRQARELWNQSKFDACTARQSLKLSIISAYVSLQLANRTLEVEKQVYDNMSKLSDLTAERYAAGAGPEADSIRARIAAIQEQQVLIADVAAVNAARATLNDQLGRAQNTPVDAGQPLTYEQAHVGSLPELTKRAEAGRPELQSATATLRSLMAVPGLERSALYPNLVVGKDFGPDNQLYFGLSVPIDLGGIRGAVNKAEADVKAQMAQVEFVRQSIDLDVKSSYINVGAARDQLATYDDGVLKLSETLVVQVRHGYELGANTIVDVITAENTFRSVESAYYAAVSAYVQATYVLRHAVGDLPDDGTTLPGPRGGKESAHGA